MNLEELIDSQPEANLLGFLLMAPPRSFSLFELAKRLGTQEQTILARGSLLLKHNYIKRFTKNATTYLILNQNNSLFPQVRATLLKKTKAYEDELFSAIKKVGEIQAAFLSGLFVGQPKLPVDILLIGKIQPSKLEGFIKNCEHMMHQEINYTVLSVQEFLDRRNTFDRFIKDIFDYPHIIVVDKLTK